MERRTFLTIPTAVLGDALLALLLVIIIVFIDTLTKWTAIAIRFCKDKDYYPSPMNLLRAVFFRAWEVGYLESKKYKWNIMIKFVAYSTVILLAVFIFLLFPQYEIQGFHIGKLTALLLYVGVIFAELFSIAENLKEAGFERSQLMDKILEAGLQRIGVNYRIDGDKMAELPKKVSTEIERRTDERN